MARPTKLSQMSPAEKAEAKAGLKELLKKTEAERKTAERYAKDTAALLAKVKGEADKQLSAAAKEAAKKIKAAEKEHDAAVKRNAKVIDAATKGVEKIKAQLAAFDTTATSTTPQSAAAVA